MTQEVLELLDAQKSGNQQEIFSEAADVLVNVLSFAQELGIEIRPEEIQRGEKGELLEIFSAWNEGVQALRKRYSRKTATKTEVESLTKTFLAHILNYTAPDVDMSEIISSQTKKLMSRENAYKKQINIKDFIANYPDFPKPGIHFKDISPILTSPDAMRYVAHEMVESCRGAEGIVALDARGFLFAPLVGQILGIPVVMLRKKGKLPGKTVEYSYDLEYGSAIIEIQKDAIKAGQKVSIIDDLLATGGTALAAVKLVESLGGTVHNCSFVISLDDDFLAGFETRKALSQYRTSAVVSYSD